MLAAKARKSGGQEWKQALREEKRERAAAQMSPVECEGGKTNWLPSWAVAVTFLLASTVRPKSCHSKAITAHPANSMPIPGKAVLSRTKCSILEMWGESVCGSVSEPLLRASAPAPTSRHHEVFRPPRG